MADAGSENTDGGDGQRILLYRGSSLSPSRLSRGCEQEMRVARSRDATTVEDVIPLEEDERKSVLKTGEGYVKTDTGYLMIFVREQDLNLTPLDIISLDDYRHYRVSEQALESLPTNILYHLEDQQYVRLRAAYDGAEGVFREPELGWRDEDETPWDILMREISEHDEDIPVVDYVVNEYGPDRWSDPETIAETRDVKPGTVRKNIHSVRQDEAEETED